jgi:DNA invertase Pin-like site-specific DNA recombinase
MNKKRCAIYTRKSHAEGLDQDFNSLDAQREACEAFITSQRHEGWVSEQSSYDDAAYSGGTLDRPALAKLLNDISAGLVQVIVVYKVDRLTRSLADFAKLIELFDQHDVSFVSVTQQFNTTSSMGRLTLNVLLSFAQFEREITGERIRDKFAASKQKGMWMGGNLPLGYDVEDRKLKINKEEADSVRLIFTQYLKLGNVRALKHFLDREGVLSKKRTKEDGSTYGGVSISRGGLYKKLSNPIYKGDIRHKDKIYSGQHDAIVDEETWGKVQALLAANAGVAKHGLRAKQPSLLAGILFDDKGNCMSPSHAVKNNKRYRYYTSQALIQQKPSTAGSLPRIPAGEIEGIVRARIKALLNDELTLNDMLKGTSTETKCYLREAKSLANNLARQKEKLRKLLTKVIVSSNRITLLLSVRAIHEALKLQLPARDSEIELHEEVWLQRCQGENKLILNHSSSGKTSKVNPSLVNAVARAYIWNQQLVTQEVKSIRSLAKKESNQPLNISLNALCKLGPLDWADQLDRIETQFST